MSRKSVVTEAPYDRYGNLCHHQSDGSWYEEVPAPDGQSDYVPRSQRGYITHGPDWRPIAEFTAELVYDGYSSSASAAYVYWKDAATGTCYPMFMTDLDAVLSSGRLTGSVISGRFTVVKRGQNFGITYLGPT